MSLRTVQCAVPRSPRPWGIARKYCVVYNSKLFISSDPGAIMVSHSQKLFDDRLDPLSAEADLHILATSDLHMALRGYDYLADRPTDSGGMARIAALVRRLRTDTGPREGLFLAFDNGDSLQGGPHEDVAIEDTTGHVFYRALALAGFDAAGLGNHDFDFGLDRLDRALTRAPIPILASNVHRHDGKEWPVRKLLMLKRQIKGRPIDIGVFSVLPPQTIPWNAGVLTGRLAIDDIAMAAAQAITELKEQGADIVIALAHTGEGEQQHFPGQENALGPVSRLPGLDCILAGHAHRLIADNGSPAIVMPGMGGEYLGHVTLALQHGSAGWTVTGGRARLHRIDGPEAQDVLELTRNLHMQTRDRMSRPIGRINVPMHSYFGALTANVALATIAEAQRHAVLNAGDLPADLPVLSAVALQRQGGTGDPGHYNDIPAGPFLTRHLHDLCPFSNRLAAVIVTGAELAEWIEMSAGLYGQIAPGKDGQMMLDPDWPTHASDLVFGLEYSLDLSRPPRFRLNGDLTHPDHRRLNTLQYRGSDLRPEQRFVVAVSAYRADGGGSVAALCGADRVKLPRLSQRQAVADYVAAGHCPDPRYARPCRFGAPAGADLFWRTGAGALAHLDDLGDQLRRARPVRRDGFVDLHVRPSPVLLANPGHQSYIAG